ncbi:unnamed protein product [Closterium sp. NIES-53]
MATAVLDTPDAISTAPPVQVQVISQWETALQSMVEEKVRSWYKLANQGIFTRRRTKGGKKHHHHDAPPLKQQQRTVHRDAGEHQHHSGKHHKKHHRGAENAAAPAHAVDVRVECEEGAAETTPLLTASRTQQLEQKLLKGERVRAVWGIVTVGILVAPWGEGEGEEGEERRRVGLGGSKVPEAPVNEFARSRLPWPEYQEAVEAHMHSIAQVWDLPILRRPSASALSPSADQQQAEPSAEPAGAGASAGAAAGGAAGEAEGAGAAGTGGAETDPESGTVSWAAAAAAGAAVTAATTVAAAAAAGETAAVEVLGEMAEAVVGGEGICGEERGEGEAVAGGKWRNGEEGIGFMAHTQEPIRAVVHPLFVYAWGHMVAWLTWMCLALLGFRRHLSPSGLVYFHRPGWKEHKGNKAHKAEAEAESGAEGYDAVVFIHGLGIGLTPYLAFIHMLLAAFGSKVSMCTCL